MLREPLWTNKLNLGLLNASHIIMFDWKMNQQAIKRRSSKLNYFPRFNCFEESRNVTYVKELQIF